MMVSRIMMTLLMVNFLMIEEISAMEPEKKAPQKKSHLTSSEEGDLKKKMLLKEHAMNQGLDVPDEVHGYIGEYLHALSTNPVLDATLQYTNPRTKEKTSFKVDTKVKDGMIDLSDKAFGDVAKYLVITTDLDQFFADHGHKVLILIAPWSLIRDNLGSSAAPFEPLMQKWNQKMAPIGIFLRAGNDKDKSWYKYNIDTTLQYISWSSMSALNDHAKLNYVMSAGRNYTEELDYKLRFDGDIMRRILPSIKLIFPTPKN